MPNMTYDTGSNVRIVIENCHGDLKIEGGDRTQVEVSGDRSLAGRITEVPGELTIGGFNGDLRLRVGAEATIAGGRISGDVVISQVAAVEFQSVGGDLTARRVGSFKVDDVGGDLEVELTNGTAQVGRVGGDVEIKHASQVQLGVAGGDADLKDIDQLVALGRIGGDLDLSWTGNLAEAISGVVGGDVELRLTQPGNFAFRAVVGGKVTGIELHEAEPAGDAEQPATETAEEGATTETATSRPKFNWGIKGTGGELVATFGEGGAELHLTAGGDLDIQGGNVTSSSFTPHTGFGFDVNMDDFAGLGEEMRRFGREMKAMGRELAREVAREVRYSTRNINPGPRPRIHVQVNDRAFHFDEEQIDRLTQQAREAAASGVARAQEAVERALVNMVSGRRRSPVPPVPPVPPAPGAPRAPYVGQTVRIERETPVATAPRPAEEVQTEKLAILRMVSEGRMSIDEAELMLRALEDRG